MAESKRHSPTGLVYEKRDFRKVRFKLIGKNQCYLNLLYFFVFRPQQSFLGNFFLLYLLCCVYILQGVFVHLNLHQGEVTSADW